MIPDSFNSAVVVLWIVLGALLCWALWSWLRDSRARRAAAHAPEHQQLEWHADFMKALIGLVGRDTSASRRVGKVRDRLDWDRGRFSLVLDYLDEKGLVRRTAWGENEKDDFTKGVARFIGGERVKVTSQGLDELERARHGPTKHLPHIEIRDSVVAIDSPGAVQNLNRLGLDPIQLAAWMTMYRNALDQPAPLSDQRVKEARRLLRELQEAVDEADGTRVEQVGRTLRSIAEGVAGNVVFTGVVAAARALGF